MALPVLIGASFVAGYVTSNYINGSAEEKVVIVDDTPIGISFEGLNENSFKTLTDSVESLSDEHASSPHSVSMSHSVSSLHSVPSQHLIPTLADELINFNKDKLKKTQQVKYEPKSMIYDLRQKLIKRRLDLA